MGGGGSEMPLKIAKKDILLEGSLLLLAAYIRRILSRGFTAILQRVFGTMKCVMENNDSSIRSI